MEPKAGRPPTVPYKLAVLLLYGHVPGIERLSPTKFLLGLGPLSVYMGTTSHRVREHLETLANWGVIRDLRLQHGTAVVEISHPIGWETSND